MTDLRTAAQQALEALEFMEAYLATEQQAKSKAITALRAALAEPVQEPVAWMTVRLNVPIQTTARKDVADEWLKWGEVQPLYTAPPRRPTEPVQEPDVPETNFGNMEPAGWLEGPFGEFRANQLFKHSWPAQTVAWSIPLYLAPPQRKP